MKVLLIKVTIFLLFFPSMLGLLIRFSENTDLSYGLICLGLLLFCIEQCRMAIIDLDNYFLAKKRLDSSYFYFIILSSTIALELVGFYYCFLMLNVGAIIILISQIWFNSLARIKIQKEKNKITITPWGIKERIGELLGACFGIILIILWTNNIYPLFMAFFMLLMSMVFIMIKYLMPNPYENKT